MGLWNKLFGGVDGWREAMRESYEKHLRLARAGKIPATDGPHAAALYGALGSRYRAEGIDLSEILVWADLAPFLMMRDSDGIEALTEYVVFRERPNEARTSWLRDMVNTALRTPLPPDHTYRKMAALGMMNRVHWVSLLDSDTGIPLIAAAQKMAAAMSPRT